MQGSISYLYLKMIGTQEQADGAGLPMPPSQLLDTADLDVVRRWIKQGAPRN